MLTLDQLPFQAEGYRDLVCLITNCGKWHCGPTVGSRRRGGGWTFDITIALSQTCTAIHAWYYTDFDYFDCFFQAEVQRISGVRNTRPRHS